MTGLRSRPMTPEERARCHEAWQKRLEKRKRKQGTRAYSKVDSDLQGIVAEERFAIEAELARQPEYDTHGDGRVDFTLYTGETVDVKCTAMEPPRLALEERHYAWEGHADVYVLARWAPIQGAYDAELMGWLRADEIPERGDSVIMGAGRDNPQPGWYVPVDRLHDMEGLLEAHLEERPDPERFAMRLPGGREVRVSINHEHRAVRVGDVVFRSDAWARLLELPDAQARLRALRAMEALDGELVDASLWPGEADLSWRPDVTTHDHEGTP